MYVSGRLSLMYNLNSIFCTILWIFVIQPNHFSITGQNEYIKKNTILKIRSPQTNPFIRTQYHSIKGHLLLYLHLVTYWNFVKWKLVPFLVSTTDIYTKCLCKQKHQNYFYKLCGTFGLSIFEGTLSGLYAGVYYFHLTSWINSFRQKRFYCIQCSKEFFYLQCWYYRKIWKNIWINFLC